MKRLSALLSAILLSLAIAQPVLAINPPPCGSGQGDPSYGFIWERRTSLIGSNMTGARMLVVARALEPCTLNPLYPSAHGKSAILVSFDGTVNGNDFFAQLGLIKSTYPDQTYFGWTDSPTSGGQINLATWADFDGNGQMDTPVGGRSYTFSIERYSVVPTDYMIRYSIRDNYLGVTKYAYQDYPNNYQGAASWVGDAWWGCEAGGGGSNKSYVGSGNGSTNRLYMQDAAYRKVSDGAWYYTQNSTIFQPVPPWITAPAANHYAKDSGGVNSSDRVWCWGS